MRTVEVFADVTCPFAHVALRRFVAERDARGRTDVAVRVRAWPLELINGEAEPAHEVAERVEALRRSVAPELFRSFDPDRFPTSSLPALAAEASTYRADPSAGERFSMSIRTALFEDGCDITDPDLLADLGAMPGDGRRQVLTDWDDGKARQVQGSPHFFVDVADYFCPSMKVDHRAERLQVSFDRPGFESLLQRALR